MHFTPHARDTILRHRLFTPYLLSRQKTLRHMQLVLGRQQNCANFLPRRVVELPHAAGRAFRRAAISHTFIAARCFSMI